MGCVLVKVFELMGLVENCVYFFVDDLSYCVMCMVDWIEVKVQGVVMCMGEDVVCCFGISLVILQVGCCCDVGEGGFVLIFVLFLGVFVVGIILVLCVQDWWYCDDDLIDDYDDWDDDWIDDDLDDWFGYC